MNTAPTTDTLLYLNGVTVSFDGFKALNALSLIENGRPLKFAADAEIGDFRFVEAGQIGRASKEDLAGIGPGLAGDERSNSVRSWINSMPISSHCFWPWLRRGRRTAHDHRPERRRKDHDDAWRRCVPLIG